MAKVLRLRKNTKIKMAVTKNAITVKSTISLFTVVAISVLTYGNPPICISAPEKSSYSSAVFSMLRINPILFSDSWALLSSTNNTKAELVFLLYNIP